MVRSIFSLYNYDRKFADLEQQRLQVIHAVEKTPKTLDTLIENLERESLSFAECLYLRSIMVIKAKLKFNDNHIVNLLKKDLEIKYIIRTYNKTVQLYNNQTPLALPFVFVANKLNRSATSYRFKAIKAGLYSETVQTSYLQSKVPLVESQALYPTLSKKIRELLQNILEIYSSKRDETSKPVILSFQELVDKTSKITNLRGKSVIKQLDTLYLRKQHDCVEIAKLYVIQQKINLRLSTASIAKDIQSLDQSTQTLLNIDPANLLDISDSNFIHKVRKAIATVEQNIKKINDTFEDILNKVNDDLAVYEVSSNRLVEEFSPTILQKPIDVTMIGVEYAGFVKEGGLAEALEGLTKAMKAQHPNNHVRLIFPKFSILPSVIQDKLKVVKPKEHKSSNGSSYKVYTMTIDGIEYNFIEHPSFILKDVRPSIYGPDSDSAKKRFTTFSSFAADFVKTVQTDVIHLHDWHVAGVALKLQKSKAWREGSIPPIVFTYHNNSRAAQGRFISGIYNYDSIIQGLIEAGIATENVNVFVETLKKADAITTVSETFGIESQDMRQGEGVSFAARAAAEAGKLTGIINGSNPKSWNPEIDASLKNWKDPETGQSIDLTYGPTLSNAQVMDQKEKCKKQLQKWISQNFPKAKIDCTKPIVTYVGRLDSYQKGLDKLEEAIVETIKNGGQFIVMGSLEDSRATSILNKLQVKYKENVLFIRDYKDANGRYHFQQGDMNRQGCGSLVRGATDFLFIPSKFEPCGLVQFEGWLFGSLAIGSKVGGLADTIIPLSQDSERFNGFLFDRNSKTEHSIKNAIQEALKTWSTYTKDQKGTIVRRLITDGRKCSWTSAPVGYSPVEKYRFVYENARKFAKRRNKVSSVGTFNLLTRIHKIRGSHLIQHDHATSFDKMEEEYQAYYHSKNFKFKKLEEMYLSLPIGLRMQVPSPYGRKVEGYSYKKLGAHLKSNGVQFTVEAPHALQVEVKVFTATGENIYKLEKLANGCWTGFVPDLKAGTKYQYFVNQKPKLDPLGLSQVPHPTRGQPPCSVVVDRHYKWQDKEWMIARGQNAGKSVPTSIYEVHPLFWKKKNGKPFNYREIADKLVKHCKDIGYTHVELMGILEHPDQRSWGYQVTGFFAPTRRMGSPQDFKYLVDTLHKNKIGVYLDWVPAHFALDDFGLNYFDGTHQYEPADEDLHHSSRHANFKWGTHFFDFGKKSVRNFLISSASYWLKEMHIDGLRADAIKSILMSEDPESSRCFLRDFNAFVHREFPGVVTMAEDYSGSLETTQSVAVGGFGFDRKWNVCWMKNALDFFSKAPQDRPENYDKIVKSINGDLFHKMILAISHDEVTKTRKALIQKNSGLSTAKKFANLRAFFGFMMSVPGKKLLFMGNEFGLDKGWNYFLDKKQGVVEAQHITDDGKKVMATLQHLNKIYKTHKPLWQRDNNANDLMWIEKNDPNKRVLAFRRTSDNGESIACLSNFSNDSVKEFTVKFEDKEVFNKFKKLTLSWLKKHPHILETKISAAELAYLSCYPTLAKKIKKDLALQDEFFKWMLIEKKSTQEFFQKKKWKTLKLLPKEIFNSDDKQFGGLGRENRNIKIIKDAKGRPVSYKVQIPPLSCVFISEKT